MAVLAKVERLLVLEDGHPRAFGARDRVVEALSRPHRPLAAVADI